MPDSGVTSGEADEVRFGRSQRLRVFVSSKMRGGVFREERAAVAAAVESHPDFEVWMWERSANAGPYCSIEVCRGNARASDLLILILDDDLTDATEIEWQAAKAGGAVCIVLRTQRDDRSERAEAFLAAETAHAVFKQFGNPSELRAAVVEALRQNHTHAVREDVLRTRRIGARLGTSSHLVEAAVARAEAALHDGSPVVALEVVSELDASIGDPADRPASVDIAAGVAHGHLGDARRAAAAFKRAMTKGQDDPRAVTLAHQNLSLELLKAGDLEQARALMQRALELFRESEDWFGVLQMLLNLANADVEDGEYDHATDLIDLAAEILAYFRGDLAHQRGSVLGLRGTIAAQRGEFAEALRFLRRALAVARRGGDRDGECVSMQNLGSTYLDMGRPALARRWLSRSLAIAQEVGTVWRAEGIHRALALAALAQADYRAAITAFEAARLLAVQMNDPWRAATLAADIAAVKAQRRDADAEEALIAARNALTKLGDRDWLMRCEHNIAQVLAERGDREGAISAYERAIACAEAPDSARELRRAAALMCLTHPPDVPAAIEHFRHAADTSGTDDAERAWTLAEAAAFVADVGSPTDALILFDDALTYATQARAAELTFHIGNDRALTLAGLGRLSEAESALGACLDDARSLHNRALEAQALQNLAETRRRLGHPDEALDLLASAIKLASSLGDGALRRELLALQAHARIDVDDLDGAERDAIEAKELATTAHDRATEAAALACLARVAFFRENYDTAATLYQAAARLRRHDRNHHDENLHAIAESWAAHGDWPRTLRASQRLVDHAQRAGTQADAWESLVRAARWFLDRGEVRRAATLDAAAVVLAHQSPTSNASDLADLDIGQVFELLLTIAFHVAWSPSVRPERLWGLLVDQVCPLPGGDRQALQALIEHAREAALEADVPAAGD